MLDHHVSCCVCIKSWNFLLLLLIRPIMHNDRSSPFSSPDPVQAGLLGSITIPIAHFTGNPLASAVAACLLAYLVGVFKRDHVEL